MKKNRIAALLIAAMTAVSMTACGNTASDSTSETTAEISAAEETPAEGSSAEDISAEDSSAETSEETSEAAEDGVKVVNDREGGTVEIKGEINIHNHIYTNVYITELESPLYWKSPTQRRF